MFIHMFYIGVVLVEMCVLVLLVTEGTTDDTGRGCEMAAVTHDAAPPAPPPPAGPVSTGPPDGATPGSGALGRAHDAVARAHEAADALIRAVASLGEAASTLGPQELEWLVEQTQALANRHDRVRSRALDVVRRTREAGRAGHDDDAQFTAGRTRTDRRSASEDERLARALGNHAPAEPEDVDTGEPNGPGSAGSGDRGEGAGRRQSPTADAWDAGRITRQQARIITSALEDLPEDVTPEERLRIETRLVRKAQRMSPGQLRREARRCLQELDRTAAEVDAHHDALVRSEEEAAWEAASFWMVDRGDGTSYGQFVLPTLQARMLGKALQAATAPRRLAHKQRQQSAPRGAADDAGTGPLQGVPGLPEPAGDELTGTAWRDQQIDWSHERGKAFAELIDHLPTDHLGSKINAVLLVTTDLETLRGETDRTGITDTGDDVSAGQVRRLASNAGIIPVVMGGESLPLDLGRQSRSFTDGQRAALATRYRECAAEDCDRPFSWCEIHHDQPWAPVRGPGGEVLDPGGGATDLTNGIPLCGRHHRRLSDPTVRHVVHRAPDGTAVVGFRP